MKDSSLSYVYSFGRLTHQDVGLDLDHIFRTDEGELDSPDEKAAESDLGDDCYVFILNPEGIVQIEKWNIEVDE